MTPRDESPISDTVICIELTNGVQSIKELYFNEGKGSLFTYRKTRIPLQWTVVFIVISVLVYFLSLSSDQVPYVFIFTIASLIGLLIRFLLNAGKYFKWKRAVNEMIKTTEGFKKVSLNVKSSGFEAVYDDQVVIEKWANFKRATISPTHIYLIQKEADYLFPASSMQESEYEALSQIVRSKIANEEADNENPTHP